MKSFTWLFLALVVSSSLVSGVADLIALQGNVYESGSALALGNLSVELYENNSCSDYFYYSGNDFNDSIVDGQFDVVLGNETQTEVDINRSKRYLWIGTQINSAQQSYNSTGGKCRSFSNPLSVNFDPDWSYLYLDQSTNIPVLNIDTTVLNATIDQRILLGNATYYSQWRNDTYYSDEWWINRGTINASNYNFTFNDTRLAADYYNKTEIDERHDATTFNYYLTNHSSAVGTYLNMTVDEHFFDPQVQITETITGDGFSLATFITAPNEPGFNLLTGGLYSVHLHLNATTAGKQSTTVYWELRERYGNNTEVHILNSSESSFVTFGGEPHDVHGTLGEDWLLNETGGSRLVLGVYANLYGAGGNPDLTANVEGASASRFSVATTISAFKSIYLNLSGTNANQNIDINAYNLTTGNLLPATNNTYDLGSMALTWKDVYISGDIIADVNRYIRWTSPIWYFRGGALYFQSADRTPFRISYGQINSLVTFIHNVNSGNWDFIVRGDNDANLIYADAGLDRVGIGIGNGSLTQKFTVNGTSNFTDNATFEQNVSANWFNGQFNWTTNSSQDMLNFNGTQLNVNETAFTEQVRDVRRNRTEFVNYEITANPDATTWTGGGLRILQNETLTGLVRPAEPPRTVQLEVRAALGNNVDVEVFINGTDANGDYLNYTFDMLVTTGTAAVNESESAFAMIDYIVATVYVGNLGDTYGLGLGNRMGLPNYPFNNNSDLFHWQKDGLVILDPTFNATYGTVLPAAGAVAAGQNWFLWYRTDN